MTSDRFELHYHLTKESASIHRAGCLHGRPKTVRVIPLAGATLEAARLEDEVLDLEDREYTVKSAPCTQEG